MVPDERIEKHMLEHGDLRGYRRVYHQENGETVIDVSSMWIPLFPKDHIRSEIGYVIELQTKHIDDAIALLQKLKEAEPVRVKVDVDTVEEGLSQMIAEATGEEVNPELAEPGDN